MIKIMQSFIAGMSIVVGMTSVLRAYDLVERTGEGSSWGLASGVAFAVAIYITSIIIKEKP